MAYWLSAQNASLFPSKIEIQKAESTISDLCGEDTLQRFEQNGGQSPQKSFVGLDLQRSSFVDVEFNDCDFTEVAATGVVWPKSTFNGCCFDQADFEYADLTRCSIGPSREHGVEKPSTIRGAGFNGVIFRNAQIQKLHTQGSSFAHADFSQAHVSDMKFDGTFEGCIFNNTEFENTSFKGCNIEYADFSGAKFSNSELELLSLPYVFGIQHTQILNGLRIVSGKKKSDNTMSFSWETISGLKGDLMNFYASRRQYFACANLALLFGDFETLKIYIQEALNVAWESEDYRSLKFVCKLIRVTEDQTGAFGATTLRKFYDLIVEKVGRSGKEAVRNQYEMHDGHIRALLVAEPANIFQIHIQSTTSDVCDASTYANHLIVLILQSCEAAGITIQIVSSQFSFNSNSRHVFGIRIVSVNQQIYQGEPRQSDWNVPTAITVFCSVMSLLFTGIQATQSLFDNQAVPKPAPNIQQTIINNNITLKTLIVPETFVLKQRGVPLTGWTNGRVIIYRQDFPEALVLEPPSLSQSS